MSDIAEENPAQNYSAIREDIVQTAVKFLQNHNVINTPLAQKQKFLQRKGLTDQEIQVACERAGAYAHHDRQNRELPAIPPPMSRSMYNMQMQPVSLFHRFKEVVHNVAIISAVAYAIYMFYKKFIRPYLFGGQKKKSVEETVNDLSKSVSTSIDEIKETLVSVKVDVQSGETNTQRQLHDLKSEISTVKGLLLNRKQFPSVSNSPVVPPSIPAWQLASQADPDTADAKSEDMMEIGSGSGSEHEQGTKNSDSSLEIIACNFSYARDTMVDDKNKLSQSEGNNNGS